MTGTLHKSIFKFMTMSLNSSYNEKCLDKSSRDNQNTYFMLNMILLQNRTVCETISKNMTEPEGTQTTSQYGAYELYAG